MTLEAGDSLPSEIRDQIGTLRPRQILYFMRTADCAVCRGHVRRLVELSSTLAELNAELTVFAPDDELPAWAKNLPLRVVMGKGAYEAAGFHRTLGAVQQSGTIVARRDGKIEHVRRATLPFQAFHERELLSLLQPEGAHAAL